MHAEDVVVLYTLLLDCGVQVWVDGGWGIDALLQHQTRPHKDLDCFVQFKDLGTLADRLAAQGFTLKQIWEENRWAAHADHIPLIGRTNSAGGEVATAFVLKNHAGHELDVHVLTFDSDGQGIPAWGSDRIFPPDALGGQGVIAGMPVRCLSAQMHMATHTGYALQDKDVQDLRQLHERFGVAYADEHAERLSQLKAPTRFRNISPI